MNRISRLVLCNLPAGRSDRTSAGPSRLLCDCELFPHFGCQTSRKVIGKPSIETSEPHCREPESSPHTSDLSKVIRSVCDHAVLWARDIPARFRESWSAFLSVSLHPHQTFELRDLCGSAGRVAPDLFVVPSLRVQEAFDDRASNAGTTKSNGTGSGLPLGARYVLQNNDDHATFPDPLLGDQQRRNVSESFFSSP